MLSWFGVGDTDVIPEPGRAPEGKDPENVYSSRVRSVELNVIESRAQGSRAKKDVAQEVLGEKPSTYEAFRSLVVDTGFNLEFGGVHIFDWDQIGLAFPIVLFYYCTFLAALFFFTYELTIGYINQTFLSLQNTNDAQVCNEIPAQITTTVEGDAYGSWATSLLFKQYMSIYAVSFVGSAINSAQYTATMKGFKSQLQTLSQKSSQRDTAWNALMWASFNFFDPKSLMNFFSTADATFVFNNDVSAAMVTSLAAGPCNNTDQYGQFSFSSAQLSYILPSAQIPASSYNGTKSSGALRNTCPLQFPYGQWNYYEKAFPADRGGVQIQSFDIRTAATAVTINLGLANVSAYTPIPSAYKQTGIGSIPGKSVINTFYMNMDPMFCLDKKALQGGLMPWITNRQVSGPDVCLLATNSATDPVLFYPMVMSMWQNPVTGQYKHCKCPDDKLQPECNERNFVVGMFYDLANSTKTIELAMKLQKKLVDDPVNGDLAMQDYFAEFFASALYINPPDNTRFTKMKGAYNILTGNEFTGRNGDVSFIDPTITYGDYHKDRWKYVCPGQSCGAFVFRSVKTALNDVALPLNKYSYEARLGPSVNGNYTGHGFNFPLAREMCMNTIYYEPTMNSFASTPPVQLIQSYYECKYRSYTALKNAVGG
jgi:hypothetical protein